jgi:hypothetical protein
MADRAADEERVSRRAASKEEIAASDDRDHKEKNISSCLCAPYVPLWQNSSPWLGPFRHLHTLGVEKGVTPVTIVDNKGLKP